MSNSKKLVHTVACLVALTVISIPFYSASSASAEKRVERQKMERLLDRRVYDDRLATLIR